MAGPSLPAANAKTTLPGAAEQKSSAAEAVEDPEAAEVVIFQIKECFVYKIPPRKSAASYRADDWNINKWAWEGALRVISKGDECVIRLEDAKTGELFANAPIYPEQPVPVEAVIDSSRFFVLRIEDNSAPRAKASKAATRHAFIGMGFRDRTSAFDFQEAVYDHVKYLNKKKEAQELGKEYDLKPAADFTLKEGQTLKLDIKRPSRTTLGNTLSRLKLHPVNSPSTPGAIPALPPVNSFPVSFPPAPTPATELSTAHTGAAEPAPSTPLRQTSGEHSIDHDLVFEQPSCGEGTGRTEGSGEVVGQENGGAASAPAATDAKRNAAEGEDDDFGDFQAA